ncbi:Protein CBG16956 [Caenorhabditis briggsae]|uniref:Glycosyltransferase family 92 protein n=1 Tax=Caenorhabditis briggsae TaxID=6238 RepID=A8XQ51_CAEBR|nr:Protein CBG16956 [Caenorhabditis briggsae]CAP34776.1 Protein CBG16956 [Caenorhabditis briggsae]
MKELDNDEMDLFFVSAYYYGNEYSFYENQVSLTFLAPRDAHWDRRKIIVIRSNGSNSVLEPMKVHRATPHNICKFVTITGTVTLKDDLMDLEILVNKNIAGIRYLPADNKQRDLVVCTPPIYNNVRWQSILLIAHIYARFNGHLQLYLSNSKPAFFDLLEELKQHTGISVSPFPDFFGNSQLDEIEFGGITVASSDCLSKYKSSASFIAFLEWDEFLIPTRFSSFFDEFANFFESEIFVGLLEYKNSKGVSKIVSRPFNIGSIWLNEPVERPYKLKTKKI